MVEIVDQVECEAPAKINLCLKVLGKRADGFHEIFSVMQAVDLYDEISFTRTSGDDIFVECNDPEIPTGSDNLISRAFQIMKDRYSFVGGVRVRLRKRIPPGSGLGGGSSNCAAAIRALDRIFCLGLTSQEMSQIGATIGSDVPFFFSSGTAFVTGRGEIVEDINLSLEYSVLIVIPDVSISTHDVYSNLKLGLTRRNIRDKLKMDWDNSCLTDLLGLLSNDLEEVVLQSCPEVRSIRKWLTARGFEHVSMSGSGSAVFAIAPVRWVEKYKRTDQSKWGDWKVFAVQPILLTGV
jgi:4-diphosphocytidyl-2-C-methyl-D-erythritol kinase